MFPYSTIIVFNLMQFNDYEYLLILSLIYKIMRYKRVFLHLQINTAL